MARNKEFLTGFTLIEVIIAMAVVVAAMVVFGVAVSSLPLTKNSRNQNIAYHAAAKKIEELRKTPFASLPASGGFSDPALANLASSTASLTVSDYSGSSQIKQITVIVNWNQDGASRNLRLDTLIGSNGLNP